MQHNILFANLIFLTRFNKNHALKHIRKIIYIPLELRFILFNLLQRQGKPKSGTYSQCRFYPIRPPSFSIIFLQIANPNPVPCLQAFNLTKRSNIVLQSSSEIPIPVSETETRISSFDTLQANLISPSEVNLIAFVKKLEITCTTRFGSEKTVTGCEPRSKTNRTFFGIFKACTHKFPHRSP